MSPPSQVEPLMASEWRYRKFSAFPYQTWLPFPPEAIVQVKNMYGESRIGRSITFWWGYEPWNLERVITKARRLDRIK